MANADLLRQLFRAYVKQDNSVFRMAAEAIISEERAKNHRLLADDLENILVSVNGRAREGRLSRNVQEIPKDRERGFPLLDIGEYEYGWERLVAPSHTVEKLKQIAKEHFQRDILATAHLKPTQRILFYGPPGCGKTLTAKVLASVLSYPLVTVRFDAIVSPLLGETAANLRRVFEFIEHGQWVVLFDEFDAIGKDRDNTFEHGELKRVVNTLLQSMDAFHGESILIAATNHEGLLDNALWRRFEALIPFQRPTQQDRILLLRIFLRGFDTSALNIEAVARRLSNGTGADVERVVIEGARRSVLAHRTSILREDIDSALADFRAREKLASNLRAAHSGDAQHEPSQEESE